MLLVNTLILTPFFSFRLLFRSTKKQFFFTRKPKIQKKEAPTEVGASTILRMKNNNVYRPTKRRETIAINFTNILSAGPEVSLKGSPTVSPTTAAL